MGGSNYKVTYKSKWQYWGQPVRAHTKRVTFAVRDEADIYAANLRRYMPNHIIEVSADIADRPAKRKA